MSFTLLVNPFKIVPSDMMSQHTWLHPDCKRRSCNNTVSQMGATVGCFPICFVFASSLINDHFKRMNCVAHRRPTLKSMFNVQCIIVYSLKRTCFISFYNALQKTVPQPINHCDTIYVFVVSMEFIYPSKGPSAMVS